MEEPKLTPHLRPPLRGSTRAKRAPVDQCCADLESSAIRRVAIAVTRPSDQAFQAAVRCVVIEAAPEPMLRFCGQPQPLATVHSLPFPLSRTQLLDQVVSSFDQFFHPGTNQGFLRFGVSCCIALIDPLSLFLNQCFSFSRLQ
jgi:hypothetical protein